MAIVQCKICLPISLFSGYPCIKKFVQDFKNKVINFEKSNKHETWQLCSVKFVFLFRCFLVITVLKGSYKVHHMKIVNEKCMYCTLFVKDYGTHNTVNPLITNTSKNSSNVVFFTF